MGMRLIFRSGSIGVVCWLERANLEQRSKEFSLFGSTLGEAGGVKNAISLRELSQWCEQRFGPSLVSSEAKDRPFDIPWLVLDESRASATWNWHPERSLESILEEISEHAERHPDWLKLTGS
jgi:UDP-glucose 4-epimerase